MNREIARRQRQDARNKANRKARAQALYGPRTRRLVSRRGRVL